MAAIINRMLELLLHNALILFIYVVGSVIFHSFVGG